MTQSEYKLLGDSAHEGADDPLEFHVLADGLVDLLKGAHGSTPLTLGIQAPWGMGKSSLMLQMKRKLKEDPNAFRTVWFNAWTFEGEDILEGMIKTVLEQLDPNMLRRALRNNALTATLQAIASVASRWLGIGELTNQIWDAVRVDPRARNQLKDMLTSTMQEWVQKVPKESTQRSIVVFVDDLDRCSPENVFAVFEVIKLYLDVPGFVFVLGVDSEIVSEAILQKKKYSERITGEQYVEKIVQIAYNIPASSPAQMQALFSSYSDESGTSGLFDDDSARLILERNSNNPRRIKRFINVFILEHQLNPDSHQLEPKLLIKIIMLGMYYRSFCLLFDPDAELDVISEFLDYEEARRGLRGQRELTGASVEPYLPVFQRYELSEPISYGEGEIAVRELDARVPEDFVSLAEESQFLKLVSSITEVERPLVAAHIKRVGESVASEAGARSAEGEGDYLSGLKILWLDDRPSNNESYIGSFRSLGADVDTVTTADNAIATLKHSARPYNLLISDVARGKSRSAGFDELPSIRELGNFDGAVIFFVGSVRAKDREISKELKAAITNDPDELFELVHRAGRVVADSKSEEAKVTTPLHHKIFSLNEAEERAGELLDGMTKNQAVERLVSEGVGRVMAESAVASAAAGFSESGQPD